MAQKRMVYTKIWESETLGYLPKEVRLLFIGLITLADDDGKLKGNPAYLRAQIFPYDDDLTIEEVREWRDKLNKSGLINVYEVEDIEYIEHPKWSEYQNIRNDMYKPSKFPNSTDKPLQSRNETETKPKQNRPSNLTKHNLTQHKDKVLSFWNSKKIIVHKQLSKDASKEIEKMLGYPNKCVENPDEIVKSICDAISVYAEVLHGKEYWWSHKWNLYEFLKRGYKQFEGKSSSDYKRDGASNGVTDKI